MTNQPIKKELPIDFAPGGQAVLEGVLMRSPNYIAVAVRNKAGEIVFDKKPFTSVTKRIKFFAYPIVRGVVGICEMMMVGFGALNFSSAIFADDEEAAAGNAPQKREEGSEEKKSPLESLLFALSLVVAFSISIFLFKFLPLLITTQLDKSFSIIHNSPFLFNFIDGVIKMGIFIGYLSLMLLSKEMRRVFEYHGAEHKAVWTYEKGLDLTVENAKKQTRFHPRCGTSFILIIFVISIFIYMALPKQETFLMNFLMRLAWLPIIGGVAYEVLKWSARHIDNALVKIVIAPGLALQRITTQEPDDAQLEVALKALECTLELEQVGLPIKAEVLTNA